jgi:hypothetical protein
MVRLLQKEKVIENPIQTELNNGICQLTVQKARGRKGCGCFGSLSLYDPSGCTQPVCWFYPETNFFLGGTKWPQQILTSCLHPPVSEEISS